jgi:hypothetical protein
MSGEAVQQAGSARAILLARKLALPAVAAGLVGGLLMIGVMILVMGASGEGYASPLNLGMPAFVYTITPPLTMLPILMTAMGITLPPAAMTQLGPALQSGHMTPAVAQQLSAMLTSMHVPAAKMQMIAPMMSGHATNKDVADLMKQMSPSARAMVMRSMPVSTSHVVVGSILHFAFAAFLAIVFFAIITAAAWYRLPGMRTPMGIMAAGVIGAAIVYVINRWALLPSTNPMMSLVPQLAFFLAHLLFGLIVGTGLAMALLRRRSTYALLPADPSIAS